MLGAIALGLAVRFGYAYGFKWDQPLAVAPFGGLGGDAGYYHFQANAISQGLWFVDPWQWALRHTGVHPGAEHPPMYTLFLAIPSSLGFHTFREHVVSGVLLGSLTCGVVGFAGRAVAGRRVGIVAAFLAAVYANLWINDALVMSETITAMLAAFVVWFGYRFWRNPSMRWALLFGFSCGLAALSRAEFAFFFPIVALPLAIRARGLDTRERIKRLAAIVLMAALPVMPWVGFNIARFNQPVTLSTGGDFTLANTYCDATFYGDRIGWWDLRCMGDRWSRPGDESDVSKSFRQDGLDYLGDHLGRFPVVVAARIGRMWDLYDPIQTLRFDSFEQGRSPNTVTRIALAQFYVLTILAIVGLVMLAPPQGDHLSAHRAGRDVHDRGDDRVRWHEVSRSRRDRDRDRGGRAAHRTARSLVPAASRRSADDERRARRGHRRGADRHRRSGSTPGRRSDAGTGRDVNAKLGDVAAAAGLRRIHIMMWRDLDDPEAGGSELHAHEIASRWASAGLDVTMRTSFAADHPTVTRRSGYRVIRRAGRYMVFPRAAVAERAGLHGPSDGLVEIWNGMPFFSPLWASGPRIVFLHHLHAEMWDMTLPPHLARVGRIIESRVAPPLYRNTTLVTLSESSRTRARRRHGLRRGARAGRAPRRRRCVHAGGPARADAGGACRRPARSREALPPPHRGARGAQAAGPRPRSGDRRRGISA